jgi:hypothetical protein
VSNDKTTVLKFLIPTILVVGLVLALVVGTDWINGNQQYLPIIVFLASPFLGWMTWAEYKKGEASLGAIGGTFTRSENPPAFWLVVAFNVLMVAFLFAYPLLTDFRW